VTPAVILSVYDVRRRLRLGLRAARSLSAERVTVAPTLSRAPSRLRKSVFPLTFFTGSLNVTTTFDRSRIVLGPTSTTRGPFSSITNVDHPLEPIWVPDALSATTFHCQVPSLSVR
jgi:hypothetical protein